VCGTSGIIAAVTKVPCFYDVRCCLAVDRERLQGRYERADVRTLITFHDLFGKSVAECGRKV
jgi:hypothetical protein